MLFCLSVSVKWLSLKTDSEVTYTVSGGALNSTQTKLQHNAEHDQQSVTNGVSLSVSKSKLVCSSDICW